MWGYVVPCLYMSVYVVNSRSRSDDPFVHGNNYASEHEQI